MPKLKPRTKREFQEMLQREYGYEEKLARDCAAIVAGHGAFPEEPKTPIERLFAAAAEICAYDHCDADDDFQEAVKELGEALREAQSTRESGQ